MKEYAKVNISAVKSFKNNVAACKDCSNEFKYIISTIETFYKKLKDEIVSLKEYYDIIQNGIGVIVEKRPQIQEKILELRDEIANLKEYLDELNEELADTSPTDIVYDDEGNCSEVENSRYVLLNRKIDSIKNKISSLERKVDQLENKLEELDRLDNQLKYLLNKLESLEYALEEKAKQCLFATREVEEIKNSVYYKSEYASVKLKQIIEIVEAYIRVKMKYETILGNNSGNYFGGININININHIDDSNDVCSLSSDNSMRGVANDNKKHNIQLDEHGRVYLYDGKTFGGKYNTYNTRWGITNVDDNPVIGYYEGERGESKFIPSNRCAEGIAVIEILKKYGLNGIEYRNAEPDFEVCSEAVVKIPKMTENRYNYEDENGISCLGNFFQADIECAKKWNQEKRYGRTDWCGRDICEYRIKNGLAWHEKCDTVTMVLVNTLINAYFRHSGGCSECRTRDKSFDGGGFDE